MKKTTFFVLSLLLGASSPSFALNYTITFTGTGVSTTVNSVIVQNLTRSTSVTVPAGNVLNLSDATAVEELSVTDETIHVYNSMDGKSMVSFFVKQAGVTQINAFGMDGKKIARITANLQAGINSFQLSLPKGAYAIQVVGNGYTYTAKMINQTGTVRKPEIAYIGTAKPATSAPQKSKSSAPGTTTMTYATGDQLLYKGTSGNYSTIVTDVPTASKTMNFDFVTCQDADLNNYSVVTIGIQVWMAENLKTSSYRNGDPIPNITDNTSWSWMTSTTEAQCTYNNDAAIGNKYGKLYNWNAVKDSRNIAPIGWHIPTDAEWTTLTNYVGINVGTSGNIAKALASTTDWDSSTDAGAVGNDLTKNNTSGFTALPGGVRNYNGYFAEIGTSGYWWSSTEYNELATWTRNLASSGSYYGGNIGRPAMGKEDGFSVRCVRD